MSGLLPKLEFYRDASNIQRISQAVSGNRRNIQRQQFEPKSLDIFVLNLNKPELVEQVIQGLSEAHSLLALNGFNLNAYIGDTGSTDPITIDLLKNAPTFLNVSWFDSYHFSRSNNDLFEMGISEFSLFLNNDVLIKDNPSSILRVLELMISDSSIGAASAVLNFPDGSLQHGGIDFLRNMELRGFPFHPHANKHWEHSIGFSFRAMAGTGAFLMVRSAEFANVNGFNESYQAECQDVELCLAFARRGFETHVVDTGSLVHLENATRPTGEENWPDRRLFMRSWASFIEATQ